MPRTSLPLAFVFVVVACGKGASNGASGAASGNTTSGSPVASDPRSLVDLAVTNEAIDVDGSTRRYLLVAPSTRDTTKSIPLVLVFHGDGGDSTSMRSAFPLDAASGTAAIVAYPTGLAGGWELYEPLATNKDAKLVDALVANLASTQGADPTRVFGVGFSSGGYLVSQLSCRKNGLFRGIVAHGAGAPAEPQDPGAGEWRPEFPKCRGQLMAPTGGVATLSIMGAEDDAAGGRFVGVYWAFLNGCASTSTAATQSSCERYDGCPGDKPVEFCLVPGLGHGLWDKGVAETWSFIGALL